MAESRSPISELWYRVLVGAAAVHLALLPSNLLSFWRSAAFGAAALAAVVVFAAVIRSRPLRWSLAGSAVPLAIGAWALWTATTLAWSIDPALSRRELKSDLGWSLVTMATCYLAAAARPEGFRGLAGALLAGIAFWPALAVGLWVSPAGGDLRIAHWAIGVYSTYLVTVAPLLLLLVWESPVGERRGPRALAVALLLLALVVATARLADTRIVWIAFAASVGVGLVCHRGALRGPRAVTTAGVLIVVFGLLLALTSQRRAEVVYPAGTSVATTVAVDPRLGIWKYAAERIAERPWHGHGYGLQILADPMRTATSDPLVTHPHNLFLGQWLQTGAVGLGLFVLMLAALAGRHVGFVRSGDVALARLGTLGLMILAGFVVKNLTDDFFLRANAKLLFATQGLLLGAGALRLRQLREG